MLASLALKKTRQQDVLTEALAHIRDGDIHSAYEVFDVHQCGPAFAAKFFYAAGLGAGVRPLPLVLDRQVACSLRELQRDGDLVLAEWARLDRGGYILPHVDGYVRYVNAVNGWAEEMNCRPDAIEMFLFDPPASFWAEVDAETDRVTT